MTSFHKPSFYISLLLFGMFHPILQTFGNFGYVDEQNTLSVATDNISFIPTNGASTAARYAGHNDYGDLAAPNLSFHLTAGLEFDYDRNEVEHLRLPLAKDDVGELGTEANKRSFYSEAESNLPKTLL